MASAREWQELANTAGTGLSDADAEALAAARIDPACIIGCLVRLVTCGGPTDPDCRKKFIDCIIGCIGGGN